MEKKILVSIITVCYNSERTIEQTIQSVLHQTYSNLEYLIIDGKSTDGTLDIVRQYQEQFGGRMKVVSETDDGIYDAMNKGVQMASGELIGIINSDDFYEPDAVEKMVGIYVMRKSNRPVVMYGMLRKLVDEIEESVSISSSEFLDKRSIAHPSTFISKSAYDVYGMYNTKYSSVADYDLFLRYKKSGGVDFIPVYDIIANFRSGGMCGTHKAYLDLLEMKKDYQFISKREYRSAKWKAQLSYALHHK